MEATSHRWLFQAIQANNLKMIVNINCVSFNSSMARKVLGNILLTLLDYAMMLKPLETIFSSNLCSHSKGVFLIGTKT